MKNLKSKSIAILIVAVLLSVNTNIFAQRGNGKGYGQFNENVKVYFCNNIPNLTADQITKIDKLRTAHWKEMQNSHNQLAEKRARLQSLRTADDADINSINETIDEISVIQASMQKNREQHFQDIRILLTEDQRVYYDNFKRGRGNGQSNGRGNRMCRGNGIGYGRGNSQCKRNW